jgi:N-acetylglucosaminyldiphosphoundecaprenol N-acetyl-beta-D-mannosaminyltransferase
MSTSTISLDPAIVMGLPISTDTHLAVLQRMSDVVERRETGHYISITNTESMYHGIQLDSHGDYIRNADFSLCDGVGVIISGWAWGHRIARFNGPVFQLAACDFGQSKGWRHFFYGGKEGVAEEMARRLRRRYPSLIVCGTYCPPFHDVGPDEDRDVVNIINAAHPDIVWVGLGLLRQERWIQEHLSRIEAPWMVGVGAAFDYHAGTVPWAPPFMRSMGLEWLFRLIIQPRLRARRYWWSLIFVVESTLKGLLSLRFLRKAARP